MSADVRRSRARRGEGERLRGEILDATETLLRREGDRDAVSIRAIADAVGCTAPSIYRHFEDKTALIFAVCDRHFDHLQAEMASRIGADSDPVSVLRQIGHAYLEFGLAHPEQYRIMFMTRGGGTAGGDYASDVLGDGTSFGLLSRAVEAAMEAGAIRRDDPFQVAVDLWTMAHGVTSIAVTANPFFPYPDPRDELDRLMDMTLRALAP